MDKWFSLLTTQHDAPVKFVSWLPDANVLLSGSWDKTLRYWDCRSSVASCTVILPERLYGADAKGNVVAAATAERKILVYDIRQPANVSGLSPTLTDVVGCSSIWITSEISNSVHSLIHWLNYAGYRLYRGKSCIAPFGQHYVRVGWLPAFLTCKRENFSWKCHRESEIIHSVHAVDFHPTNKNTLASVGGDCKFAFWDLNRKKNVYTSPAASLPITCGKFHQSGRVFAYAASYDWQRVWAFSTQSHVSRELMGTPNKHKISSTCILCWIMRCHKRIKCIQNKEV